MIAFGKTQQTGVTFTIINNPITEHFSTSRLVLSKSAFDFGSSSDSEDIQFKFTEIFYSQQAVNVWILQFWVCVCWLISKCTFELTFLDEFFKTIDKFKECFCFEMNIWKKQRWPQPLKWQCKHYLSTLEMCWLWKTWMQSPKWKPIQKLNMSALIFHWISFDDLNLCPEFQNTLDIREIVSYFSNQICLQFLQFWKYYLALVSVLISISNGLSSA